MKKSIFLFTFWSASILCFAQCQLTFQFSPNDTICVAQPTTISISNPGLTGTVVWSGGDLVNPVNGYNLNIAPNTSQTYIINWNNGTCNVTDSVKIVVSPVKAVLLSQTNPSCGKPNGSIYIAATVSSADFTFFKDGVLYSSSSSELRNNAPAGVYVFAVYDYVTGCSDTIKNIVLTDNTSFPSFTNIQTTSVACYGDKTGSIQVSVAGGTGNYTYVWSHAPSNNTNTAQNLTSGTPYSLTVKDGVCLPIDTTITLTGPTDSVKVNLTATADNCQQSKGKIIAATTGGTTPYTFQWGNGSNSPDSLLGILGPNRINLTVTDNNGCSTTASDSVLNTGSPSFKTQKIDSSCIDKSNGSISIIPVSNDGPFHYVWTHDTTLTSATLTNLPVGSYSVSAFNSFNCAQVITANVPAFKGSFLDLGADQTILLGQTAPIDIRSDATIKSISWTPIGVNKNDEGKYFCTPDTTTTFIAIASYGKGCTLNDQITIFIDSTASKMIVPTIFTPNGDGINDAFYVQYNGIKTFQIWIYDRWGAKVFESTDVDFRWNGQNMQTSNPEMDGNYGYTIQYSTFVNPSKQIVNGFVTLIK